MIRKLAELAVAIEVEMKSPQDIEGCIVGENFYIPPVETTGSPLA